MISITILGGMSALEELRELKERLERERPTAWEELPDIALYMDQLISYMPRQLIRFQGGEVLTSAMVNNYIKDGLVPRAAGKRYGPVHLGCLTAVCALKKVLSVREMRTLMEAGNRLGSDQARYEYFCQALDEALSGAAASVDAELPREELAKTALELALRAYASQLACQRILELLRSPDEAGARKSRK